MPRKIFVTTALPYANGPFHIGHIMEYIQADIWVRFQRMQGNEVHFVCADDAHGAPIMLKAEAEGITPQELVARIAADRPQYLQGFHIELRPLALHGFAGERRAVAGHLPPAEGRRAHLRRSRSSSSTIRSRACSWPDRYIKGECPNCHSKDQYGDACEVCSTVYAPTELINPYSTLSGAKPVLKTSDHYFFQLSDPRCVEFLREWLEHAGPPAAAGGQQGEGVAGDAARATRRSATGTSRAMRPISAFRFPDAPGKYFYVWLDAPIGYLASLKNYFDSGKARAQRRAAQLRGVSRRRPTPSRFISSARTSSISTRCSGPRC